MYKCNTSITILYKKNLSIFFVFELQPNVFDLQEYAEFLQDVQYNHYTEYFSSIMNICRFENIFQMSVIFIKTILDRFIKELKEVK
jgi:hypothetical protein